MSLFACEAKIGTDFSTDTSHFQRWKCLNYIIIYVRRNYFIYFRLSLSCESLYKIHESDLIADNDRFCSFNLFICISFFNIQTYLCNGVMENVL